jgi:hypothetical protein
MPGMLPSPPRPRARYAPLPGSASRPALRAALLALDVHVDAEAPYWLHEPDRLHRLLRRQAHLAPAVARLWWQVRVGLTLDQLEADAGR